MVMHNLKMRDHEFGTESVLFCLCSVVSIDQSCLMYACKILLALTSHQIIVIIAHLSSLMISFDPALLFSDFCPVLHCQRVKYIHLYEVTANQGNSGSVQHCVYIPHSSPLSSQNGETYFRCNTQILHHTQKTVLPPQEPDDFAERDINNPP